MDKKRNMICINLVKRNQASVINPMELNFRILKSNEVSRKKIGQSLYDTIKSGS